ncbi:MAG: site-specific integrase [Ruminococcaceae bacterium]|nr:site-specific integrase [Oscillospiraceae bacterium]
MGFYKYENTKGKTKWRVISTYTDALGNKINIHKRGFNTKGEAKEWYEEYITTMRASDGSAENALELTLSDFYNKIYLEKVSEDIRQNTIATKNNIFESKIEPYLGKLKIKNIKKEQITAWQEKIKNLKKKDGTKYSEQYLRTINNQLIAIFSFIEDKYNYKTPFNKKLREFGSKENYKEVKVWSPDEYEKFMLEIDDDLFYVAFQILYWGGLRVGELLALNLEDFDFKDSNINITKSYQRLNGEDIITPPKTRNSKRKVGMLKSDMEEFNEIFQRIYKIKKDTRVFENLSKSKIRTKLKKYAKSAGLEPITIHGFRHSHVSLLINAGKSTLEIADRVGHSNNEITQIYAHLYPEKRDELLDIIADIRKIKRSA